MITGKIVPCLDPKVPLPLITVQLSAIMGVLWMGETRQIVIRTQVRNLDPSLFEAGWWLEELSA